MEILDVVDEEDKVVGKATRKEVREKALLHRVSRIIILNDEKKFLMQKRSMKKDIYPGYWDIGVAGTVSSGESYVSTAVRELGEELGITGISNIRLMHSFLFNVKHRSQENNSNCKVYLIDYNGRVIMQKEEIDEIRFLEADKAKELIGKGYFHPVGKIVFEKYMEKK